MSSEDEFLSQKDRFYRRTSGFNVQERSENEQFMVKNNSNIKTVSMSPDDENLVAPNVPSVSEQSKNDSSVSFDLPSNAPPSFQSSPSLSEFHQSEFNLNFDPILKLLQIKHSMPDESIRNIRRLIDLLIANNGYIREENYSCFGREVPFCGVKTCNNPLDQFNLCTTHNTANDRCPHAFMQLLDLNLQLKLIIERNLANLSNSIINDKLTISLSLSLDGVQTFKSTEYQLWPFIIVINNLGKNER